jgi:GNAT superfamily N-acetyltransferase
VINVGRLVGSERAQWQHLFAGYNAFYGRTLPPETYDLAWTCFQQDDRMHAMGARLDGDLVGIAHFLVHASTTSADVCYLQDLFTDPSAREQGVATVLIESVTGWARRQGCSRVYWSTHETNATARRLYDRVATYRGFIRYEISL